MKKILGLIVLGLLPMYALAFDFNGCSIVDIVTDGDKNAHIQLSCFIQNAPTCATSSNFFGFDKSTSAGKQWLAMVSLAYATNSKVTGNVSRSSCAAFQGNVTNLEHLRVSK